jgi:Tol biopolymer transport system component
VPHAVTPLLDSMIASLGGYVTCIRVATAAAASVVLAGAALLSQAQARPSTRAAGNGRWIAYSTAPADDANSRAGSPSGSDVFLVHEGGTPRLVAGRGTGGIWNVCPAFSPDGRLLAFARKTPAQTIRVVGVARDGAFVAPRITLRVGLGARAPCPRWSSDSSRIAYLDRTGKVIVRGLDGSLRRPGGGDPTVRDFDRSDDALVSPTGDLVARRSVNSCDVVVSRRDGSQKRVVDDFPCSYATAGWSPDGRRLLVMKDMDGLHFAMIARSVTAPFEATPVVVRVRVNHARSWPGYGDVSWQPAPRH